MKDFSRIIFAAVDLFRRNPVHTLRFLLSNMAASLSQIVSIGSLYPIIYIVLNRDLQQDKIGALFEKVFSFLHMSPTLLNYLFFFIAVSFVSTIVFIFIEIDQNLFLKRIEYETRSSLTEKVLRSPWTYLRAVNHGRFVNVIARDVESYKYVIKYIFLALSSFIQFFILSGTLFYLNFTFAFLSFIFMAVSYGFLVPLIKRCNYIGHEMTHAYAKQNHFLISGAKGFKELKASALENYFMRLINPVFNKVADLYFRTMTLGTIQARAGEFLGYLVIAILLLVGLNGLSMNPSLLFIALLLISRIVPLLRTGVQNIHLAYSNLPSMDRMNELSSECYEEKASELALTQAIKTIRLSNAGFSHDGKKWLFRGLNCTFRKGDFWVVTGTTGRGKTTILDLLIGILPLSEGKMFCDDINYQDIKKSSLQKRIGYLTQNAFIFEGTILENITWGHEAVEPQALRQAIEVSQLNKVVADKTLNFNVLEGGSNLSGGQQQRVMIARTLLKNCDFVLMDEPSSALDEETAKNLMAALLPLKGKVGVIMVTHRQEFMRYADHILSFESDGARIIEKDLPGTQP